MPITPRFQLSQTITHLIITIHIPHIRVSASTLEIVVENTEFHFYSNPYLLHLNFAVHDDNGARSRGGNDNDNITTTSKNRTLLDDESICKEAKATYDPSKDNGTLVVKIWKEDECIWEDLDLIGKLMMASYNNIRKDANSYDESKGRNSNKIEVVASFENNNKEEQESNLKGTIENSNNEIQEKGNDEVLDVANNLQSCLRPHYGFMNMHHSMFIDYAREGLSHEMLEIPNPDDMSNHHENQVEKRQRRMDVENEKFCPDRYLGDLYISENYDEEDADMTFIEAKRMTPHWKGYEMNSKSENELSSDELIEITDQIKSMNVKEESKTDNLSSQKNCDNAPDTSLNFFTQEESFQLASIQGQIPPISQISPEQIQSTFLSLIDILYAYVYDHRITCADPTVESSWTIVILSPTLSWLESYSPTYDTIDEVLRWSIRRALIYPYIRNFHMLSDLLIQDVLSILNCGRRVVIRCLLQIHAILDKSEFHYLFNKLYINHYICWMQLISDHDLKDFVGKVKTILSIDGIFHKDRFGLNLELIEEHAMKEIEESDDDDDNDDDTSSSEESDDDSSSSDQDPTDIATNHEDQNPPKQGGLIQVVASSTCEADRNKSD